MRFRPTMLAVTLIAYGGCTNSSTTASASPSPSAVFAAPLWTGRTLVDGIEVAAELTPLRVPGDGATELREGDDVRARFTLRYSATGTPLQGVRPGAWMQPRAAGAQPSTTHAVCAKRIGGFLSESMLDAPAVDLNAWKVLVMNDDSTLSVVDPRFGFGGSRLLAMVQLPAPAQDWLLSRDERHLYVSVPKSGRVVAVDTATWQLAGSVDVGPHASHLLPQAQGDAAELWVTVDGALTCVETQTLRIQTKVQLAAGPYAVAVTDSGPALAFVAEHGAGRVAVVDLARRQRVAETELGFAPESIAVSTASQLAYAVGADSVVAIDQRGRVVARSVLDRGLAFIRFAPDGRHGLITNPARNRVYVLDASTNRVTKKIELPDRPERIVFSDTLAYVRSRDSEAVRLIDMASLDTAGTPLSFSEFPAGQAALGAATTVADAFARAPGENAMLVANSADRAIYYYQEGMAAPMGTFATYSRHPRAVLAVDRSLRERAPGTYETIARLGPAARYDLAFYLDAPRLIECFEVPVALRDPAVAAAQTMRARVEGMAPVGAAQVGAPLSLKFRVTAGPNQTPKDGLSDVRVLAMLLPGVWQQRRAAVGAGGGVYAIDLTPVQSGVYQFFVEAPSLGLTLESTPQLTMRIVEVDRL